VLWVATKATALDAALELAPPERVQVAVPLLNGVEHVARLRERFQHVVAASISVESERVAPGRVRQTSPFLRIVLAPGGEALAAELREAGFEDVSVGVGEAAMLWSKLAFLAPLALATSAAGGPQDAARLEALLEAASPEMRSSMQKDVEAGRGPELDAIGGAVLRAAHRHGIAVPATEELVALVEARPRRTIAPGSTSRR
jgi:2-dehydropantoate 2-reductase